MKTKSLPKGVTAEYQKFRARICINGKVRSLGLFTTPEAAHDAWVVATLKERYDIAPQLTPLEPIATPETRERTPHLFTYSTDRDTTAGICSWHRQHAETELVCLVDRLSGQDWGHWMLCRDCQLKLRLEFEFGKGGELSKAQQVRIERDRKLMRLSAKSTEWEAEE